MSSNREYVTALLKKILCDNFPNLNHVQVETFVTKLFNSVSAWKEFKGTLRDLLISSKSFSSKDDAFYEEEREVSASFLTSLACLTGVTSNRTHPQEGHTRTDKSGRCELHADTRNTALLLVPTVSAVLNYLTFLCVFAVQLMLQVRSAMWVGSQTVQ